MSTLAVIGGGPAGLMAAEVARAAGVEVELFDAKGSVGRKFLIAGKGGLNLTHSEPRPAFDARYRERAREVGEWLDAFDAEALRAWAGGFGIDTYVGSSGRVFPNDRKAAPLLRGWVRRLRGAGVRFHAQHRWLGWDDGGALRFDTPDGERRFNASATIMAMGGGILSAGMLVKSKIRPSDKAIEVPYGVAIAAAGLWALHQQYLNQFQSIASS